MPGPQPSWQDEPCPPWCIREHVEDDLVLDRYHQGEASTLSVMMSTDPGEPRAATFEAAELMIRVGRFDGERTSWVAIEPVSPRMTLTAESARRLSQRIAAHLAQGEST